MKVKEAIEEEEQRIEVGKEHSELATEFLREGENLVDRGDVIQASEKLYKAALSIVIPIKAFLPPKKHKG